MDAAKFATYLAVVISPSVVGIIAEKFGMNEIEACEKYFSSSLYAALSDEEQKLWHHSPELLASLLESEIKTGGFTYPEEAL